ncbi:unnamed protein product, partial [Urochloa humidicola]
STPTSPQATTPSSSSSPPRGHSGDRAHDCPSLLSSSHGGGARPGGGARASAQRPARATRWGRVRHATCLRRAATAPSASASASAGAQGLALGGGRTRPSPPHLAAAPSAFPSPPLRSRGDAAWIPGRGGARLLACDRSDSRRTSPARTCLHAVAGALVQTYARVAVASSSGPCSPLCGRAHPCGVPVAMLSRWPRVDQLPVAAHGPAAVGPKLTRLGPTGSMTAAR